MTSGALHQYNITSRLPSREASLHKPVTHLDCASWGSLLSCDSTLLGDERIDDDTGSRLPLQTTRPIGNIGPVGIPEGVPRLAFSIGQGDGAGIRRRWNCRPRRLGCILCVQHVEIGCLVGNGQRRGGGMLGSARDRRAPAHPLMSGYSTCPKACRTVSENVRAV